MTTLRIVELAAGTATAAMAAIASTGVWERSMSILATATGDDWIDRILGPLGALALALVVLAFLAKWINARIAYGDQKAEEHASLLLSIVRESSANSVRATDVMERVETALTANAAVMETVTKSIAACQSAKKAQ